MNRNLPQVIKTVRETVGCSEAYAVQVAHALDRAQLVVDPERSYGVLLRREPSGGWSTQSRTERQTQAAAWAAACSRAAALAEQIRAECGPDSGLMSVRSDGAQVLVTVQVTAAEQWGQWRQYLGITAEPERKPLPYAYVGSGHRAGVAVSVVAYDAPQVEARTTAAARMPYRHGGIVYDLALPQQDMDGDVWDYAECRADGMPLLTMRGASGERCSLAHIVDYVGPLAAVRASSAPALVSSAVEGGDTE
ncbi:BN159_2729 family protein [Streptomyces sp. NPDC055078]